jgi:hypothetical protein
MWHKITHKFKKHGHKSAACLYGEHNWLSIWEIRCVVFHLYTTSWVKLNYLESSIIAVTFSDRIKHFKTVLLLNCQKNFFFWILRLTYGEQNWNLPLHIIQLIYTVQYNTSKTNTIAIQSNKKAINWIIFIAFSPSVFILKMDMEISFPHIYNVWEV